MSPQKLPDRIVSCFSVTAEQDGGCGYRVHLQSRSYFLRKRDWLMPDRCFQRWPARQSLLLRLPQFTCWCVLRIVILAVNFILYSAIVSQRTPWQLSMWTQLLFDLTKFSKGLWKQVLRLSPEIIQSSFHIWRQLRWLKISKQIINLTDENITYMCHFWRSNDYW